MSEPQLSADGQWWWDGGQWLPASQRPTQPPPPPQTPVAAVVPVAPMATPLQPAPTKKSGGVPGWIAVVGLVLCFPVGIVLTLLTSWSTKAKAITIGVIVALAVIGGIGAASTPTSRPSSNLGLASALPSQSTQAAATASPKQASPPPAAPAPIVLSGAGSKVLPVTLAKADYRLAWTASGHDNMIVHLHQGSAVEGLVNQIPPEPAAGEEFFRSPGGDFVLEVQAATLTWNVTFTQIVWPSNPNPAPRPAPITIQGQGSKVTNPMYIPRGSYKLAWTAQGHDNFIVHVQWNGGEDYLVNQIPPDPSSGETVFFSGGNQHLFAVDAATLTWTVTFTPL